MNTVLSLVVMQDTTGCVMCVMCDVCVYVLLDDLTSHVLNTLIQSPNSISLDKHVFLINACFF